MTESQAQLAPAPIRGRPTMLGGAVRANPSLPSALAALVVITWLAAKEAGYEPTAWYPAGLLLLGLLAVSLIALPTPRPSRATAAALGLLAAYAAWSYLSIAWAPQKGMAWDGANRTLLYALVLALFALWPLRPRAAAGLLGAGALALAAIALVTLLRANADAETAGFFFEGRLVEPAGYVNANVALWFAAVWPCLALAARREVHPLLRGLFLGAAALLCGLALLGQSRGWLLAAPVLILLAFAVLPGRARTLILLAALAVGGLAMAGPVLDVYDASRPGGDLGAALADATRAILLVAGVLWVLGTAAAFLDRRASGEGPLARRADRVALVLVALALLAGLVAVSAKVGNPVSEVSDYWDEFKRGGTTPSAGEARLSGTAATDRYDFWRVGMEMFADRPLNGYGADNFQQEYFVRGEGDQQPRYPHSLEVRVLAQTGLVGALLLAGALGAGLVAAAPALRRRRDLGAAVAAGALLATAYWLVHGSLDWFWEFAGLGALAFAALGLAAGLGDGVRGRNPGGRTPRIILPLAGVVACAAAISLAAPWFAERHVRQAGATWRDDPDAAFRALDRAASLNPLSPIPELTAGTIAVRLGRLEQASAFFLAALERDPRDAYANLQLGAIASEQGNRAEALRRLRLSVVLNPRYDVSRRALRTILRGRPIKGAEINQRIVEATRGRIGTE